jgi:hypothetical protein
MGYAVGAVIAGAAADTLGYGGAIGLVAGLTAASGLWVLRDMPRGPGGRRQDVPGAEADVEVLRGSPSPAATN